MSELLAFLPDLLYSQGRFLADTALLVRDGVVESIGPVPEGARVERLTGRALLPGLVNAHSHAFQRTIRGRTEWRESGHETDDFWTWREQMYRAAMSLTPDEVFAVSRMCFLEMALAGITTVGEFHYLHRTPEGKPYDDPNELSHRVIAAAREVGLRIALLRVCYARSGFNKPPNPDQVRFIEPSAETYLKGLDQLRERYHNAESWAGMAPHSVRAVPRDWLVELQRHASQHELPLHMHLSEQPKEIAECQAEYTCRPVELAHRLKLLGPRFTAVHAVHLDPQEKTLLAVSKSTICACPTTERNLGDGIVDPSFTAVAVGTDSQVQIDPLEDVRELEYHLRLQKLERAVLAPRDGSADRSALARWLFACASVHGSRSLGAGPGTFEPNASADFFCVDLADPSIAGASRSDLLAAIVFSMQRTALVDVAVRGNWVVRNGRHARQEEIVREFAAVQKRLWGSA
jgi:formimidoylglutamate deiminase